MVAAYIFISAAQRDLLNGLGLPKDRVFVRHNLIPSRSVPEAGREDTVVYAGRLDEAKGLRLLMAGWDRYTGSPGRRGLRLVVVGAGPMETEVAAWAAERPGVSTVGQVDAQRCAELMAAARAVLLPSTWEETFGLVAIEAMALGVPPVAADHGSFPELITPGVDGALEAGAPQHLPGGAVEQDHLPVRRPDGDDAVAHCGRAPHGAPHGGVPAGARIGAQRFGGGRVVLGGPEVGSPGRLLACGGGAESCRGNGGVRGACHRVDSAHERQ